MALVFGHDFLLCASSWVGTINVLCFDRLFLFLQRRHRRWSPIHSRDCLDIISLGFARITTTYKNHCIFSLAFYTKKNLFPTLQKVKPFGPDFDCAYACPPKHLGSPETEPPQPQLAERRKRIPAPTHTHPRLPFPESLLILPKHFAHVRFFLPGVGLRIAAKHVLQLLRRRRR
ncbi:hypothetical protein K505DRAFT_85618 [Melanomma pulvis-pyrius CBS 109.77]|uniref:Uncharacterized protein n=1 Tax=Melanomma pulvis-pyrius CBS 109.77 TaxID=1314802 RepID=A0A6A6X111_9PLEO|nr:hypothetical protein K505DRAFT_85618 [Melanomma pulvis-pyrius CBS 109.77]